VNAAVARYRRALGAPHVLPLVASSVLARMPIGVLALALVLFLREHTGSYGSAGTIAGVFAFADALAAPVQGRMVDRLGQTRVIVPTPCSPAGRRGWRRRSAAGTAMRCATRC